MILKGIKQEREPLLDFTNPDIVKCFNVVLTYLGPFEVVFDIVTCLNQSSRFEYINQKKYLQYLLQPSIPYHVKPNNLPSQIGGLRNF